MRKVCDLTLAECLLVLDVDEDLFDVLDLAVLRNAIVQRALAAEELVSLLE